MFRWAWWCSACSSSRALELAAASERGSVAILFIDLDDFKLINASLGRSAGDELIVAVARRIGRMVLRRACAEAVTWKLRPITGAVDVAVNTSAAQLEDGSLVTDVRGAFEASGMPPSSLILEMTESALIEESVTTIRLHQLRAMGVRLALDDFGTGYLSLTHLRRFPIDIVKIDHSFVASVSRPRGGALVRSIIDLGSHHEPGDHRRGHRGGGPAGNAAGHGLRSGTGLPLWPRCRRPTRRARYWRPICCQWNQSAAGGYGPPEPGGCDILRA